MIVSSSNHTAASVAVSHDRLTLRTVGDTPSPDITKAFEAMVLRPMVEAMLPEGGAVFGEGAGADVWRSFLAGALADAIAENGGTGLSKLAFGQHS
jgi:hypothetical protein